MNKLQQKLVQQHHLFQKLFPNVLSKHGKGNEFFRVETFKDFLAQNMNACFEHTYDNEHFCILTL